MRAIVVSQSAIQNHSVRPWYLKPSSAHRNNKFRCHKILGLPLEWAPWGPILLTLWVPHWDFGAPFELSLLARREVAFGTATMSESAKHSTKGRRVEKCFAVDTLTVDSRMT